ncbi:MAG: type III pantothenate kinase [Isosphaeraceae bacterium]|nr:type III pantothenate kinase [Isosphaeraceae bacterium]
MMRATADVGNSRIKWGIPRAGEAGAGRNEIALDPLDEASWSDVFERLGLAESGSVWAISSVAPATTDRLIAFLERTGAQVARVFRSGGDVPIEHEIEHVETSGADRALGVLAASRREFARGVPGFVISCGTAITVDRVSERGAWLGGAILPGLGTAFASLHDRTARLPEVRLSGLPPAWGRSTVPAIEAGVFWGCVGGIREVIARQSLALSDGDRPWQVWTGGDARLLGDAVAPATSYWIPGLVSAGIEAAMGW